MRQLLRRKKVKGFGESELSPKFILILSYNLMIGSDAAMGTSENPILSRAVALTEQLITWRRKIHAHPELSFQEKETSRFVADMLRNIPGMQVETGVGYTTAVVGTLSSGPGPVIAIRADMDALPIQEENGVSYRSRKDGVMHACGHDAHTAIALGAARILGDSFQNAELQGTVKFLFQPAEESAEEHESTGAPYMIKAEALRDVQAVIALHMSPENSVGEVKIHDGYSMASNDVFNAVIYGTGGHGAYPHLADDPVWMLSQVLPAVYGIPSRRVSPLAPAVISIGKIQTGSASNVLPSEVEVEGTIRSYHPEVRERLHRELRKAFHLVTSWGGNYRVTMKPEDPALNNDAKVNHLLRQTFQDLYPDFKIIEAPFGLGGEDFSHMTQKVPGAMFFLGCAKDDGEPRNLHTPVFDINEDVLPVGAAVLAETAARCVRQQGMNFYEKN